MGYRAPSARDVYSYVFRLDKYSRSLTDGFSLSIIFVNDNSPVCQDLISHYFVDLCHRTADRIRIIFFSELPESYFEDIERSMRSSSYSAKNGLLNQVIEDMPRSSYIHYIREILDDLLKALHWRNYNEVDFLLSTISKGFGPRYADALYRLVRQHRDSPDWNIEEALIHELISEMENNRWRTGRDRFRRMYEDHWRDLTPDPMIPIDAPERTRELSFDVKNNTAMPGVGESMRFAARLGIGRHVPCFVFFTDIGELTIDVFPVGNLSAHEAYNQMRNWIDSFYQENQVSLNKWNQVEQDIISFINSINQPLRSLKNWINKSEELWNELRLVAQTIVKLRKLGQETTTYKSLIDNINTPSWRCNGILSTCRTRLETIYNKREKHQLEQEHLETVINRLKTISDSPEIYNELLHLLSQPISSQISEILEKAIQSIKQLKSNLKFTSLENQLFQWWGNIRKNIPSFNKFKEAHNNADQDIKSKYKNFIVSIFELPFMDTLEILLEKTKSLSDECGLDFSEYSLQLVPFFTELHTNVPKWIDETNLTISDILPFKSRDGIKLGLILNQIEDDHPINKMIRENMTPEQKKQREILISETERKILQCRDEALTQLIKLREQALDVSTEEKEAYSAFLRDMYNLRDKIEKELTDLANSSPDKSPRLVESKDIKKFLTLLNEYKETVNNFVYPYKQDRRVQEVNLSESFSQIFELQLREDQLNISKTRPRELQTELGKTIPDSQAGVKLLQDVQQMSYTISPKARLASEIFKIKQKSDLPRQSSNFFGLPCLLKLIKNKDSPQPNLDFIRDLNSNILENLEEKLYELNDTELRVVLNSIAKLDTVIESRSEILDIIFTIVGLLPDRELATHRQYANRPINLEVTTVTEQSKSVEVEMNFHAPVTGATGKNDGTININISDHQKTLAEAANEIEQLLKQLEKTNPSATEPEQAAYIDASVQPNLKQRTIAALRSGGETAIEEFFLENKYLKVGKAVVKAWLRPSS
jgi:hypothetical protein